MASPVKLSHMVLQTNQIAALRDWYLTVLGGEVVHENPHLCFLAYDDEHHRIALLNFGPLAKKGEADVGLHHVAFTFSSLGELLGTYERLKGRAIAPHWCINHGPTTSLYYHDPDGNGVELQVDNFADVADCKAYHALPRLRRKSAWHRVRSRRDAAAFARRRARARIPRSRQSRQGPRLRLAKRDAAPL